MAKGMGTAGGRDKFFGSKNPLGSENPFGSKNHVGRENLYAGVFRHGGSAVAGKASRRASSLVEIRMKRGKAQCNIT